jgi:hypothetical protein
MGPAALIAAVMLSGLGHVKRQHAQALRAGQNVFFRRAHRGNDVPALGVKVAGGFQAVARRAASDQYGFHLLFPWVLSGGAVRYRR